MGRCRVGVAKRGMGRRGAAGCEARAAVEGDGVKECMMAVEGQASKAKRRCG